MAQTNGIGSSQVLQSLLGQSDRVTATKKDASTETTAVRSSDSTALSSTASSLFQAAAATDDVRADKVAAVQSAIAAGTYSVPASAVADKLIDHLLN